MLKAWNTGHPGGIATVHANSALGALSDRAARPGGVVTVPRRLIAEAIDIIVFIAGRGSRPTCREPRARRRPRSGRRLRLVADLTPLLHPQHGD
jgi:Flp pilus assembly CpaF family ATPase